MIPTALFAFSPATLILGFMTSAAASEKWRTDIVAVFTILSEIFQD